MFIHQLQYLQSQDYQSSCKLTKESIKEEKKNLRQLEKDKNELSSKTERLKEEILVNEKEADAAHKQLKEIEAELKAVNKKRESIDGEITDINKKIAVEETSLDRLKDKKREILKHATLNQVYAKISML